MIARLNAFSSAPGFLLIRLAMAAAAVSTFHGTGGPFVMSWNSVQGHVSIGVALLLVLGFLTPIAAFLFAGALLLRGYEEPEFYADFYILGLTSVGLALAGPGNWSLDAVLFGKRRISIPRRPR